MSTFTVTLEDGRTLDVNAPSEADALTHAKKAEASRVSSERHNKLGKSGQPDFSAPVSAVKVK
jgi:hypothetical protein